MKITTKIDEKLDHDMFHKFFEAGMVNFITRFYPNIHNENDIDLIIKKAYRDGTVKRAKNFLTIKLLVF